MVSKYAAGYRGILRELRKSLDPSRKVNSSIKSHYRAVVETRRQHASEQGLIDLDNVILFLHSQREHKRLVDRYNPLHDLTEPERIKATANRVGLNLPKEPTLPAPSWPPPMFLFKALRQAYTVARRYTMPSSNFSTQVMPCDPTGITFTSAGQPEFLSSDALAVLKTAAHHLCDLHETVVFPTETVYGLGAVATNAEASAKIFSTKSRPPDNPLIVHISSMSMLEALLPPGYEYPKAYKALIKHFWPGALTLLFPRNSDVIPTIITAGQPSVAIRMPSHPVARALIAVANVPLAAPSANTSGKPSPTRAEHVSKDLDGKVPIIIDGGACGVGLESTVVDGLNEDGHIRILRPGGITVEQLESALKEEFKYGETVPKVLVHKRDYQDEEMETAPTTPGMKYVHYSPSVPVTLLSTITPPPPGQASQPMTSFLTRLSSKVNSRHRVGVLAPLDSKMWATIDGLKGPDWRRFFLGPVLDPSLSAQRLFDGLLTLEAEGVAFILIEEIAETHEGLAVMNRVRKASGKTEWIHY